MKSILQEEKECYLSGRTDWLEEHHIFYGQGRRKLSERYGLKVWLNHYWHNEPPSENCLCGGVHFNKELRRRLEREGQRAFEQKYPGLDFRKLFGRSYIEEEKH